MKKLYFLLFGLFFSLTSFAQVINEIDADTPGSDVAEFVELKWTPNTALDGYVVVFYNGSNDTSYAAYDLDGKTTDANGFFILANASLASGSDFVFPDNGLQNGPDAVALFTGNDTDFPNGTPVTNVNLVDALVYGTADPDATGLLTGLGETIQYDESANGNSAGESVQRKLDGTYETKAPTFRQENDAAVCELTLTTTSTTCDATTMGVDTYTATLNFTGGGTATYSVMADSGSVDLSGGDPTIDATGTINVTGVSEGTDVTITVTGAGGLCDLSSVIASPVCEPATTLPLYENFEYGGSSGDLTAVSGGNWVNHSGSGAVAYGTTSLSMSGYPSSGLGGSASVDGALGEDVNRSFEAQTSGTVYLSALVNISAVGTSGNYFLHLKDAGTSFRARIAAKDDGSGNILYGIGASGTVVYGTTPFSYNTTYLVVGTYNIDSGVSNLYVMSSPSPTEPVTPEATDTGTAGTTISSVALRQSGGIPTAVVDGINVSKTWYNLLSSRDFLANNFKLFPNPSSNGIVNIVSTNNSPMEVRVFDILGKQVRTQTVNSTLNVSGLKSGIYILNITQEGHSVTKKLVIE